jgi:hypothetical protein
MLVNSAMAAAASVANCRSSPASGILAAAAVARALRIAVMAPRAGLGRYDRRAFGDAWVPPSYRGVYRSTVGRRAELIDARYGVTRMRGVVDRIGAPFRYGE